MSSSFHSRDPQPPVGGRRPPDDGVVSEGMADMMGVLASVRRRWPLLIAAFVVGFVLALAGFLLFPFPYSATATLLVEPREQRTLSPGSEVVGQQPQDAAAIESQVQIMASPSFLKQVAATLRRRHSDLSTRIKAKSYSDPAQQAEADAEALGKVLKARRRGLTYMIDVVMTSADAAFAAEAANAAAEQFMSGQSASRADLAGETSEWLAARIAETRDKVIAADRAVAEFKAKHDLVDAGQGSSLIERQITDLVGQLGLAKSRTAEAKSRLDQVERMPGGDAGAVSDTLQSPALVNLRAKKSEAERALAEQASTMGELHPSIIAGRSQVADLRRQIEAEIARVRASLRNEFVIARGREQTLERQLARLRESYGAADGATVQLRELDREARATRTLYEQYLARQKEAADQRVLRKSEVRSLSAATAPLMTTRPSLAALLPLSFAVGLASALLALVAGGARDWRAAGARGASAQTREIARRDGVETARAQARLAEREAALASAQAELEIARMSHARAARTRARSFESRREPEEAFEIDPSARRKRRRGRGRAGTAAAETAVRHAPAKGEGIVSSEGGPAPRVRDDAPSSPERKSGARLEDLARVTRGALIILVTSAERKAGRSSTARGLAQLLAREGRRALVVSFDPQTDDRPGLADAVFDDLDPLEAARPMGRGVDKLGSGLSAHDPDAADLAADPELGEVLDELLDAYDVIVVDGPRLGAGAEAVGAAADAAIVLEGRGGSAQAKAFAEMLSRRVGRPAFAFPAPPRAGGRDAA